VGVGHCGFGPLRLINQYQGLVQMLYIIL
jgi:hypothetical protein